MGYGHNKCFTLSVRGTDFRRLTLESDVRIWRQILNVKFWRLKSVQVLKELKCVIDHDDFENDRVVHHFI